MSVNFFPLNMLLMGATCTEHDIVYSKIPTRKGTRGCKKTDRCTMGKASLFDCNFITLWRPKLREAAT